MIIRETRILECWCQHCHKGQMKAIFEKSFDEKKHISEYVGQKFNCEVCGFENVIEDYLQVIPHSFMVANFNEISKTKSNNDIGKFLTED